MHFLIVAMCSYYRAPNAIAQYVDQLSLAKSFTLKLYKYDHEYNVYDTNQMGRITALATRFFSSRDNSWIESSSLFYIMMCVTVVVLIH